MIPFNKPVCSGRELEYISDAWKNLHLSGDGIYTKKCHHWLETFITKKALLTHSCTAALELAALAMQVNPGDEIIMPSYTFVSTANAFVLRGAKPVFVDIRIDTLNIDEKLIEQSITKKTKAIVPVHYAGVACEMDSIMNIAKKNNLIVIEDAAQAIKSSYKNIPLGGIGHFGALSFHETKNISSGEGGALLINSPRFSERAEIMREKGTNRNLFLKGQVDKYTWVDQGSSYLPSDILAAVLWAQLENSEKITTDRLQAWDTYHSLLRSLEDDGHIMRPKIPDECQHNGHIYYILLRDAKKREGLLKTLKSIKINALFHYVPLHSSPGGIKYGETKYSMTVTNDVAQSLIRLPLFFGITKSQQFEVVDAIKNALLNK